jgi:tRNA-dihydrouridine synthase B
MKDLEEGPLCFQLAGADPAELAEATKVVTGLGANLIDLNCGCPVKKIRRKGAGSSLLMQPTKLYQLIRAMKANTSVPVSIKIRVESDNERFHEELVKVVSEAGADFLVVHGRHWTEHYETACRLESIRFFVENLKIPVIGNGDVRCVASLNKMLATGCAGVMISRATVGQPWLIKKLRLESQQQAFIAPPAAEIGAIFIEHVSRLQTLLCSEKFALLQARKLAKYYARGLAAAVEFCVAVNACACLADLRQLCSRYFD